LNVTAQHDFRKFAAPRDVTSRSVPAEKHNHIGAASLSSLFSSAHQAALPLTGKKTIWSL